MGKDNSCAKTSFEIQKEMMSEELKKVHNTFANGLTTIEDDINIYNSALEILREFNKNLITLKNRAEICTEKIFTEYSSTYVSISKYFVEYEKGIKSIPRNKEDSFKREYLNKIESEIINALRNFLDKVIIYLNNCISDYTFFLTTVRIQNWNVYPTNYFCRFEFGIDFK